MKALQIIFLLLLVASCRPKRTHLQQYGSQVGVVDDRLSEASGLVSSIKNPGFLWTINDGGNTTEVFLIDQHAKMRLVCKLDNVENRDWEDIGIDIGPDGKSYLYIADIGDNFLLYDTKIIYRFEEPFLGDEEEIHVNKVDTFVLRMPDGEKDTEAILIDPINHDLFIFSKLKDSVGVYLVPPLNSKDTLTIRKIVQLPIGQIVAGSITQDGKYLLLKNYTRVLYWERSLGESLPQLLIKSYDELPYQHEQQGESIAWSNDGTEFFTLGESSWREQASLICYKK
ncbi:MAG TPA: hypothetical protein VFE57_10075 [Cyclobacteriaceae bacterium]|nr:hypothetical protein [Cyclobacteriaceae bacterium]